MTWYASPSRVSEAGIAVLFLILFWSAVAPCSETSTDTDVPFPFELTRGKDISLAAIGSVSFTAGVIVNMTVEDISESQIAALDSNDVNSFDRSATSHWSPAANAASYVTLISAGLLPIAVIGSQFAVRQNNHAATLLLMYAEAITLTFGVNGIIKGLVHRERPFLYNSDLSLEARAEKADSRTSFFSGHASLAFCSAVFFSTAFSQMYPHSRWRYVIWPASLALAGTTGLLRYTAGKHFPTDVLTGAAWGALTGFLVPMFHRTPSRKTAVYPALYPTTGTVNGIVFMLRF